MINNFWYYNSLPKAYTDELVLVKGINIRDIKYLRKSSLYSTDRGCTTDTHRLSKLYDFFQIEEHIDKEYNSSAFVTSRNYQNILAFSDGNGFLIKINIDRVKNKAIVANGDWGTLAESLYSSNKEIKGIALNSVTEKDLTFELERWETNARTSTSPYLQSSYAECRIYGRLSMEDIDGVFCRDSDDELYIQNMFKGSKLDWEIANLFAKKVIE